jgi:hypothetical protein
MTELQNVNGSATAPTVPSHGSSANPQKDKDMNSTKDSTAAPAATSPFGHLPNADQRDDVVTQIAIISSLFTVCALAVNDAENWSDDVGARIRQEIRCVLEWGALMAGDTQLAVERKLEALS